jgi:hypothetical protein
VVVLVVPSAIGIWLLFGGGRATPRGALEKALEAVNRDDVDGFEELAVSPAQLASLVECTNPDYALFLRPRGRRADLDEVTAELRDDLGPLGPLGTFGPKLRLTDVEKSNENEWKTYRKGDAIDFEGECRARRAFSRAIYRIFVERVGSDPGTGGSSPIELWHFDGDWHLWDLRLW